MMISIHYTQNIKTCHQVDVCEALNAEPYATQHLLCQPVWEWSILKVSLIARNCTTMWYAPFNISVIWMCVFMIVWMYYLEWMCLFYNRVLQNKFHYYGNKVYLILSYLDLGLILVWLGSTWAGCEFHIVPQIHMHTIVMLTDGNPKYVTDFPDKRLSRMSIRWHVKCIVLCIYVFFVEKCNQMVEMHRIVELLEQKERQDHLDEM